MTAARTLVALAACGLLAACAKSGAPSTAAPSAVPASGKVGYVRMDDLVKKHPLYGQLAQYESNIEALNLDALVPHALVAGPELKREEERLNAQLSAAAKRTDALLQAKGKAYQDRENAAIIAALRGSGASGGPGIAAIQSQMEGTAQSQAAAAGAQAQRDLDARIANNSKRRDAAQINAAQQTLAARADRTFRAKRRRTQRQGIRPLAAACERRCGGAAVVAHAAFEPRARRCRRATPPTPSSQALDRKEADALAADAQSRYGQDALRHCRAQLKRRYQPKDMNGQVAQIAVRAPCERFRERADQLRTQFAPANGPLIATSDRTAQAKVNSASRAARAAASASHALHAGLHESLSGRRQSDDRGFPEDARGSLEALRYQLLTGTDAAATQSAATGDSCRCRKKHERSVSGRWSRRSTVK